MTDNRNTILAVILSGLVLIGWQYFFNIPQMEKQRAAQQIQSELVKPAPQPGNAAPAQGGAAPTPSSDANPTATTTASAAQVRRPLYDTSLAQWRNYEQQLDGLRSQLLAAGIPREELT